MFPGQASQYPDMLARALRAWPAGADIVDTASDVLGWSVREHYSSGNPDVFARNRHVQVGVFLVNHLYLQALRAHGVEAAISMGLSLGEYNHLVHIGVIAFSDALRLVYERGRLYEEAPAGAMLAVHPIDEPTLRQILAQVQARGVVDIANYNSPTTFIVAGAPEAIDDLSAAVERDGFASTQVIDRRLAMHSTLFLPVGERLLPLLRSVSWRKPVLPYVSNLLGRVVDRDEEIDFPLTLSQHVHRPVLWSAAVQASQNAQPIRRFIEVGPKRTLCGLLRRICPGTVAVPCDGDVPLETLVLRCHGPSELGSSPHVHEYLQHFIHEENAHTFMLAGYCNRYGGGVLKDMAFSVETKSMSTTGQEALTFGRTFVLESFLDFLNCEAMRDDTLDTTVRQIHRVHHIDEARHMSFDKIVLQSCVERLKDQGREDEIRIVATALADYGRYALRRLANPSAYKAIGLTRPTALACDVGEQAARIDVEQRWLAAGRGFLRGIGLEAPASA